MADFTGKIGLPGGGNAENPFYYGSETTPIIVSENLVDIPTTSTTSTTSTASATPEVSTQQKTAEAYTGKIKGPTDTPGATQVLGTSSSGDNIEDEIHNAYIEAEKNTGDNRTSGSVAGSAVSDNGVNNNKKAGQFLVGSHNSTKSSNSLPGYSLL